MTRSFSKRLDRLAKRLVTPANGKIIVWCLGQELVEETIDKMIAEGQISESDRERCVYWQDAKPEDFPPGQWTHEQWVDYFYEQGLLPR